MRSRLITLKLQQELVQKIDRAARANLITRSAFIREAISLRLNDQHVAPNPRLEDTLERLRQAGRKWRGKV